VIFFVSPQLWAWKKHRIKLVQKHVDEMLVIFPFEEQFYRDHGVNAEFVGHPLADLPLPSISRESFAMSWHLQVKSTWIALLPGSRAKEIRENLPEMLAAARLLVQRSASGISPQNNFEFTLPLPPTLTPAQRRMFSGLLDEYRKDLTIRTTDDAPGTLLHARASIVASGTATVEAALMGNPFVVVYRVSPVTYAIAKRVVTVPHVAMANLIADRRVVPELIQHDFTATNIVEQIELLLPDGTPRQSMMKELKRIRDLLNARQGDVGKDSGGAIDRVAAITLEQIGLPSPVAESVQS
ncbi:MAG: lipid-A-disaccharide synthase, partial [Terracidiphilus sp.]